ncbi:MAG TPA: hypothetical protein VFV75_13350 [Candidatus Polarisedimenticolaceae bacterium]|nr:hypothetical protein [Candidatus Polarisedimenticolaceae bacterium]
MRDFLTGMVFALAGGGISGLLLAGRRQLRGERLQGRRAGLGTAVACVLLALLLALRGAWGMASAACTLGAGACALLGGLSGKPVPAAWFAAALLLASLVVLLAC